MYFPSLSSPPSFTLTSVCVCVCVCVHMHIYVCACTHTHMHARMHVHTQRKFLTGTTSTRLVTTTLPVPEVSNCGGRSLMVHGCTCVHNRCCCRQLILPFISPYPTLPPPLQPHTLVSFLSLLLFFWVGVGWFSLNCFGVETVTKVDSSSFDVSEALPRGERFKEVVCRVSGVRDYGCGFAKRAGCVDWLNQGKFAASDLWGCLKNSSLWNVQFTSWIWFST